MPTSTMTESPAFLLLDESALIPDDTCYSSDEDSFVQAYPTSSDRVLECHNNNSHTGSPVVNAVPCIECDDSESIKHAVTTAAAAAEAEAEAEGDSDDDNNMDEPTATAIPIATPTDKKLSAYYACTAAIDDTSCSTYTRPEYLYTRIFKPTPSTPTGIVLHAKQQTGSVYIRRIEPGSLLSKSNLRAGDRILSINGISCLRTTATRVANLIRDAPRDVSIMVRNKHGNATLVSSCVQKRYADQKCGIAFQTKRGALHVSRVDVNGLFGNSLLTAGHRCCWINEHVCAGPYSCSIPSQQAAEWVCEAPQFVTIVSRPNAATAMVLACETNKVWFSRMAVGFGLAAGAMSAVGSIR